MSERTDVRQPATLPAWASDVLRFWFEEAKPEQWFKRDAAFDQVIRARFAALHEQAARMTRAELDTPETALAAVIVLDQFSRNLYRDSPRAYAWDAQALALANAAIEQGFDRQLPPLQRAFLYMPYQHVEDRALQARSVELFDTLGLEQQSWFAREHRRIIDRFGRFPHRNAVLSRASTPEELEFMRTHPGF